MPYVQPPNPVPFKTDAQLWLCGRWGESGLAIVNDGRHSVEIELAQGQFDFLAILVQAASKPTLPGQSWVPSGFVTADELRGELARVAGSDRQHPYYVRKDVIRMIYRLRELFAKKMFPKEVGGRAWARRFLESGKLGYRLSSPPANLRLAILDGTCDPPG